MASQAAAGGTEGSRPLGSAPTTARYSARSAGHVAHVARCASTRARSGSSRTSRAYAASSSTNRWCWSITATLRLRRRPEHRAQQLPEPLHRLSGPALDGPERLPELARDLRLGAAAVVGQLDG